MRSRYRLAAWLVPCLAGCASTLPATIRARSEGLESAPRTHLSLEVKNPAGIGCRLQSVTIRWAEGAETVEFGKERWIPPAGTATLSVGLATYLGKAEATAEVQCVAPFY
ncbi:MAG: hypothetical protein U1E65_33385 [Myxococcota bacterium]